MSMFQLIETWERLRAAGERYYLATVVYVEGSAYRKPGAQMLIAANGERVGTISGGCLEAEVARRAAWLTVNGPTVQEYRSEDDEEAYRQGTGCGGTISVLIQAAADADPVLIALARCLASKEPFVLACGMAASCAGSTAILLARDPDDYAIRALREKRAVRREADESTDSSDRVYIPFFSPPHLFIFGGGDDALPLTRFALELGWRTTVADGRAQLLRRQRFSPAVGLQHVEYSAPHEDGLRSATNLDELGLSEESLAVLLTHSFDQDFAILEALLQRPMRYLGVLGPVRRTRRLVRAVAARQPVDEEQVLRSLHTPVGLPIGSDTPAAIALAIIAEIQAELAGKRVTVAESGYSGAATPL